MITHEDGRIRQYRRNLLFHPEWNSWNSCLYYAIVQPGSSYRAILGFVGHRRFRSLDQNSFYSHILTSYSYGKPLYDSKDGGGLSGSATAVPAGKRSLICDCHDSASGCRIQPSPPHVHGPEQTHSPKCRSPPSLISSPLNRVSDAFSLHTFATCRRNPSFGWCTFVSSNSHLLESPVKKQRVQRNSLSHDGSHCFGWCFVSAVRCLFLAAGAGAGCPRSSVNARSNTPVSALAVSMHL
jgi:hypothetical protein